jgi:2-polyprenyl-3-methyl-5-hydroxy-6-metoxy-1,4-benzoquinol methylase
MSPCMAERVVNPEILDSLDPSDPAAIRSRKDLRRINWFMRGEAWILQQLVEMKDLSKVVEIGAGDGHLATKIKEKFPAVTVIAVDLLDRPESVPLNVEWQTGDVMQSHCFDDDTVVVANLFIHHLDDEKLFQLGEKISSCRALIMAEPHRYWFSKLLGYLMFPLINRVTRHDMLVSIDAGFRFGELAGLIDVDWHWDEHAALGGIRSISKQIK